MINMEIASVISTLTTSVVELLQISAAHDVNKTVEILLSKIQSMAKMIE